jgi:hypothetical protein
VIILVDGAQMWRHHHWRAADAAVGLGPVEEVIRMALRPLSESLQTEPLERAG